MRGNVKRGGVKDKRKVGQDKQGKARDGMVRQGLQQDEQHTWWRGWRVHVSPLDDLWLVIRVTGWCRILILLFSIRGGVGVGVRGWRRWCVIL
jgi:hypothetical protein